MGIFRRIVLTTLWIRQLMMILVILALGFLPATTAHRWSTSVGWYDMVLCALIACICICCLFEQKHFSITLTDIFFLLAGLYMFMQYKFIAKQDTHSLMLILCWFSGWFFLRYLVMLEDLSWLSMGYLCMFLYWGVKAFQQWIYHDFKTLSLTADMGNAGYFALDFGALIPFFLAIWLRKKSENRWVQGLLLFSILLGLFLVSLSFSRAALLGCLASFIFLSRKEIAELLRHHKIYFWSSVSIVVAIMAFMIWFKQDSFFGRMTIYKLAWQLWLEHRCFGVGLGRFPVVFNALQASYFSALPWGSKFMQLGDETYEAFNIVLQLLVEVGWVGVLFIGAFIFWKIAMFVKKQSKPLTVLQEAAVAGLVSMLVSSCFANTFHTPFMFFLLLFYVAHFVRHEKPWEVFFTNRFVRSTGTMIVLCFISVYGLNQWEARQIWQKAHEVASFGLPERSLPMYARAYPILQHDGAFLYNYGVVSLATNHVALAGTLADRASLYASGIGLSLLRGDICIATHQYAVAERSYMQACYMAPSRILPQYKLWQFYRSKNDAYSEDLWRKRILLKPPKVANDIADAILQEVRNTSTKNRYLNNASWKRISLSRSTASNILAYP